MAYENELNFAKELAEVAGNTMKKYYRTPDISSSKEDGSPVTKADLEINRILIDKVKETFPTHGVLGEEESYKPDRSDLWVCDPIDGTMSYINHVPTSMFSLAFVVDGNPVIGVAFNPWVDDIYIASEGMGAYRNGEKIFVAKSPMSVDQQVNVIGSCHITEQVDNWKRPDYIPGFVHHCHGIVFKLCMVAEGSFNGQVFEPGNAHDVAATACIIREAGGKVTDLDGNEQKYSQQTNGFVASDGLMHDALITMVKDSRAL